MSEQSGFTYSFGGGEEIPNDFYPVHREIDLSYQSGLSDSKNFNSGNNTGSASFINYDKDFSAVNDQNDSKEPQFIAVQESLGQNSNISNHINNELSHSNSNYNSRATSFDTQSFIEYRQSKENGPVFIDPQNITKISIDDKYQQKMSQKLPFVQIKNFDLQTILIRQQSRKDFFSETVLEQRKMEQDSSSQEWRSVNEPVQQSIINNQSSENNSFYQNLHQIDYMQKTITEDSQQQSIQQSFLKVNPNQMRVSLYENISKDSTRQQKNMVERKKIIINSEFVEKQRKIINLGINRMIKICDDLLDEQVPKQIKQLGDSSANLWKIFLTILKYAFSKFKDDFLELLLLPQFQNLKEKTQSFQITQSQMCVNSKNNMVSKLPNLMIKLIASIPQPQFQSILNQFPQINPQQQLFKFIPIFIKILILKIFQKSKSKSNVNILTSNESFQHLFANYFSIQAESFSKLFQILSKTKYTNFLNRLGGSKINWVIMAMAKFAVNLFKKLYTLDLNQDFLELLNFTQLFQTKNRTNQMEQIYDKQMLSFN